MPAAHKQKNWFVCVLIISQTDKQASFLLQHLQCVFSLVRPPGVQPGGREIDGSSAHIVISEQWNTVHGQLSAQMRCSRPWVCMGYHTLVGPDVLLKITAVLQEVGVTVRALLCTLHHQPFSLHRQCICPTRINTHTKTHKQEEINLVRLVVKLFMSIWCDICGSKPRESFHS